MFPVITTEQMLDYINNTFELHILPQNANDCFFGKKIQWDSIQMIYLTTMLEKKYHIRFNQSHYDDPLFYSVCGIVNALNKLLITNE